MGDPALQRVRAIPLATVGEALQRAFGALPEALLWCDAEGRVVLANAACRRLFRVGGDALAGRTATSLLTPAGHGALHASPLWPPQELPTGAALRPAIGHRPDGSTFCARVRSLPVRLRADAPLLLLELRELPPVSGWEAWALLEPEGMGRLLHEAFDVVFVADDEGRPLAADSALAQALGIGTGDAPEPPLAARWPADSASRLAAQLRRAAGGAAGGCEEYSLAMGGFQHRYAIRMLPLAALGSGPHVVVGLGIEIAGSATAERWMRGSQRLAAIERGSASSCSV
ncbi:MAG: PAS domain-containing protein [Candidatus Lambdaproteobacteria bacterium]|nr:PAS domain-containing protein [Candidatus Lambdaproteobacteria bacterium]